MSYESRPVLPMVHADRQLLNRGGVNASCLYIVSTGKIDAAAALHPKMMRVLLEGKPDAGAVPDLDRFLPENLARRLAENLRSKPQLSDPGLDHEEQRKRFGILQTLRSSASLDLKRELTADARSLVGKESDAIRSGILHVYGVCPAGIKEFLPPLQEALLRLRLEEPDWKSLAHMQKLLRLDDKLQQMRPRLPKSTFALARETIAGRFRESFDQAVLALALDAIQASWTTAKTSLLSVFAEVEKRSAEAAAAVAATQKVLQQRRADAAKEQHVSRASVMCKVDGPDMDQILAGLHTSCQTGDEASLVRRLTEQFELRLRETCKRQCPWANCEDCLPDLIRAMPPALQADICLTLIDELCGPGQSFYESIERKGIDANADFLYRRAEPTIDLTGRDMEQFHVTPMNIMIVSLPAAIGPKDHQIQEKLRRRFRKHDPDCTFTDAIPSDRTITVTRLLIGWPIAIEGQGQSLLEHYVQADAHGHFPHLLNLFQHAANGKALPEYLRLAKRLQAAKE